MLNRAAEAKIRNNLLNYLLSGGSISSQLPLKFGKKPKIIIKSQLQRSEQSNSGRLQVYHMQVCLPKFRDAQSSGDEANTEGRNGQLLCTFSYSHH